MYNVTMYSVCVGCVSIDMTFCAAMVWYEDTSGENKRGRDKKGTGGSRGPQGKEEGQRKKEISGLVMYF